MSYRVGGKIRALVGHANVERVHGDAQPAQLREDVGEDRRGVWKRDANGAKTGGVGTG